MKPHAERSRASTERVRAWAQPNPCGLANASYASAGGGPTSRVNVGERKGIAEREHCGSRAGNSAARGRRPACIWAAGLASGARSANGAEASGMEARRGRDRHSLARCAARQPGPKHGAGRRPRGRDTGVNSAGQIKNFPDILDGEAAHRSLDRSSTPQFPRLARAKKTDQKDDEFADLSTPASSSNPATAHENRF